MMARPGSRLPQFTDRGSLRLKISAWFQYISVIYRLPGPKGHWDPHPLAALSCCPFRGIPTMTFGDMTSRMMRNKSPNIDMHKLSYIHKLRYVSRKPYNSCTWPNIIYIYLYFSNNSVHAGASTSQHILLFVLIYLFWKRSLATFWLPTAQWVLQPDEILWFVYLPRLQAYFGDTW